MSCPSSSSDLPPGFTEDDLERFARPIVRYYNALVNTGQSAAGHAWSSGWEALLQGMLQAVHNTSNTQLLVAWVTNLRRKLRMEGVSSLDHHACAVLGFVRQECDKRVHANVRRNKEQKARAENKELTPQEEDHLRSAAIRATLVVFLPFSDVNLPADHIPLSVMPIRNGTHGKQ